MEGQPSVFLPVSEQSSRSQGSAVGGSSSGGGGGSGASSKRAGGDVAVAAAVESVTSGVTSLAGMSSGSTSSSISGSAGGTKRTRSSSGEGCHRGITEAVLMVQKGKLPKLDPLEDQVKAEYAHYREDVTRRALHILTDELPRRIASFLKVVDVNAPPGTLLVCDDLAAPPAQQELLPDEQLAKLRSLAAAEACDSGGKVPAGAGGKGVQPPAAATEAVAPGVASPAPPSRDTNGGPKKEKQQPEAEQHQEKGEQQLANATVDVEVLSAQESQDLTQWLETRVGELFSPSVKPVLPPSDAAAGLKATEAAAAGAAAHREQPSEPFSPRAGRRGGNSSGTSAESSSGSSSHDSNSGSSGSDSSSSTSGARTSSSSTGSSSDSCSSASCDSGTSTSSDSGKGDTAAAETGERGGGAKKQTTCQQLAEQAAFVKREAVAMRELLNAVKLFMQLHVPRIEDGNNFGVAIQEEAIHLLKKWLKTDVKGSNIDAHGCDTCSRVEESAFNLYDTVMKYFLARAKLCSKLVKYPNTMDYQMAIIELDRKEWIHLKITKLDLRNNYIMLYDLICKNWQNVVAPKGRHYTTSQASLMY